jgi:hypothetical protein
MRYGSSLQRDAGTTGLEYARSEAMGEREHPRRVATNTGVSA